MKNPLLFYFIGMLIGFVIMCGIAWLIATSNLPDWFKFFLLK